MNNQGLTMLWLSSLLVHLPEIAVCLAACLWVLARWRRIPASGGWALLGFGLILLISLLSPTTQVVQQRLILEYHESLKRVGYFITVFNFLLSVLRALACVFLGVAIFAGRAKPVAPAFPPSLPRGADPRTTS